MFGLIPDPDLPHFYPGFKPGGKIFDQFSEIYSAVGSEIKNNPLSVKSRFGADELHGEPPRHDPFGAEGASFLLKSTVFLPGPEILVCCQSQNFFQFPFRSACIMSTCHHCPYAEA